MVNDCIFDYIALLDVDDKWTYTKLELQIPYLRSYDVVGTACRYFGDYNFSPNIPCGDLTNFDFFKGNPIINSSVIIKKQDAYWDENINTGVEDYDMWYKLSAKKKAFYNIPLITCFHRIHKTSAFNNTNSNYVEDLKKSWIKQDKI
jgi:hypothetical protein